MTDPNRSFEIRYSGNGYAFDSVDHTFTLGNEMRVDPSIADRLRSMGYLH